MSEQLHAMYGRHRLLHTLNLNRQCQLYVWMPLHSRSVAMCRALPHGCTPADPRIALCWRYIPELGKLRTEDRHL